jgi:copper resistance protein B
MGAIVSITDVSAQTTPASKSLPVFNDSSEAWERPNEQKRPAGEQHAPEDHKRLHPFLRAEILEYRPRGSESDYRWDMDGWYGGDHNGVWVKSEGQSDTAFKAGRHVDMQLLYDRFIREYRHFQFGVRGEAQTFMGEEVARAHGVIGFHELVPERYEVESALFISQHGDISARLQISQEVRLAPRVILQGRFETNAAIQKVEKFTTGSGLNNVEFGLRLAYQIRSHIAPYVGVSFDHSFFGTSKLVRQSGGEPSQIRFVVGARLWF